MQWPEDKTHRMRAPYLSLAIILALLCDPPVVSSAAAEPYPTRSIRIIVPYAPGGNTDIIARAFAGPLAEFLGQSVIVENRAGASAIIGSDLVATAPPDGYTLLLISSGNLTTNPTLFANLTYDTLRDFTPITNVAYTSYLLDVHPSLSVKTVGELIALAKSKPGELNAAIPGIGTGGHLALELFMSLSGTKFTEIAYQGAGPALTDTIAGHTQIMMDALSTSLQNVRAGTVHALGQSGLTRSPLLPDVPTFAEAGLPGYEYLVYNALLGPGGMPRDIVDKLQAAFAKVGARPDMQEKFVQLGLTMTVSTPQQLTDYIGAETAKWAKVIHEAGIEVQQ
jgi:tripartite-type tricarboxylate transporter receptor subunit TctC